MPQGWGYGPYQIQEGVTRSEWNPPAVQFMGNWSKELRSLSFLQDVVREVFFPYAKLGDEDKILRLRPTEKMIEVFRNEDPILSEWLRPQSMGAPSRARSKKYNRLLQVSVLLVEHGEDG